VSDLRVIRSMPWFLDSVPTQPNAVTTCRAVSELPVLRQVIGGGEQVIAAAVQAEEEMSEGLWAVDSEDDGHDCESHQQEASQWE
jgi:hypothetical protein